MRLISADAVVNSIEELKTSPYANPESPHDRCLIQGALDTAEILCVKKEPAVDAVPVIRCKNCKYLEIEDFAYGFCGYFRRPVQPDSFCDLAVKEDKQNPLDALFEVPLEDISALLEDLKPKGEKK